MCREATVRGTIGKVLVHSRPTASAYQVLTLGLGTLAPPELFRLFQNLRKPITSANFEIRNIRWTPLFGSDTLTTSLTKDSAGRSKTRFKHCCSLTKPGTYGTSRDWSLLLPLNPLAVCFRIESLISQCHS